MALHDGVGLHHEHQALLQGVTGQTMSPKAGEKANRVNDISLRLQLQCDAKCRWLSAKCTVRTRTLPRTDLLTYTANCS
jgi:hypothetical protein